MFIKSTLKCLPLVVGAVVLFSAVPANAAAKEPRWNPCKPVEYTIDVTDLNIAWSHDIHDAFKAASKATGIPVRYAGRWPHGKLRTPRDPVLVYYKSDPGFRGSFGYTQMNYNAIGTRIVGGYVIINPIINSRSHETHRKTLYHEVGHVFGLPHPLPKYSATTVMGTAPAPYKPGDLFMFQFVGRQPGEC